MAIGQPIARSSQDLFWLRLTGYWEHCPQLTAQNKRRHPQLAASATGGIHIGGIPEASNWQHLQLVSNMIKTLSLICFALMMPNWVIVKLHLPRLSRDGIFPSLCDGTGKRKSDCQIRDFGANGQVDTNCPSGPYTEVKAAGGKKESSA